MAQLSSEVINTYREEITKFAEAMFGTDGLESQMADALVQKVGSEYNLNTIKKANLEIFKKDLLAQGMDRYGANRVSKEMANVIMDDVINEIQM